MKYYTVYRARDDRILAFGPASECARMLGMSIPTFRSMTCRVRKGETKKYAVVEEEVERGSVMEI